MISILLTIIFAVIMLYLWGRHLRSTNRVTLSKEDMIALKLGRIVVENIRKSNLKALGRINSTSVTLQLNKEEMNQLVEMVMPDTPFADRLITEITEEEKTNGG